MRARTGVLLACIAFVPWTRLAAQRGGRPVARAEVYAGSEIETYLRDLQVLGVVRAYPWSARRFTATEADRLLPTDSAHPWAARFDWSPAPSVGASVAVARPEVAFRVNSGFPYGYNDGAIWAGRGLTASGQGGVVARFGPLAATFVPLVSWAQNAGFRLQPNGRTGALMYADGQAPCCIDRPQRYGDRSYSLVDWGQSALELTKWAVATGVSSANDWWGPASDFPVTLGNNAGGFPHVFAGTAVPIDLWIVRVHGRALFGRLTQTSYSPQTGEPSIRGATGAVVVVTPRWPDGLELGATRFVHRIWARRKSVLDELRSSFGFDTIRNDPLENQLASVFFRWVVPPAGVEIYGEYGTDDGRYDLREVFVEPDHIAGYTIGLRHVSRQSAGVFRVMRAEIQNLQMGTLVQSRNEGRYYLHYGLLQGHTYLGQILGSDPGLGGAAAKVAVDWYHPGGRWTAVWSRLLRGETGGATVATEPQNPRGLDVMYTLGVEGLFFRGRYDITAGATAVYELNRDFRRDAFNLNLFFSVRTGIP